MLIVKNSLASIIHLGQKDQLLGVRMASEILQNVQKWQKLGNGQKIMKKNEKVLDISPEINATILHTPACTQK